MSQHKRVFRPRDQVAKLRLCLATIKCWEILLIA